MKVEEYLKNYLNSKNGLAHAKHVEEISLKIYTDFRNIFPKNDLLDFKNAQKLISYSALLHDIGTFLSPSLLKPHNKVGSKLVMENKIDDLSEKETEIVALCIRYHRGSKPKKNHRKFNVLDEKSKNTIKAISSILRLADALDGMHLQNVENIVLTYDFDESILTLQAQTGIINSRGIKGVFDKKKALFEDFFKLKICLKDV